MATGNVSKEDWTHSTNILCVRADNLGDVIMSGPAMRALKETFHCRITLLTSSAGFLITPHMDEVDDTIVCDLPWVKSDPSGKPLTDLIAELKGRDFDGAVIFTVYSQNPLPAALLLYMAGIPRRLAYCRENPYGLLTHWIPDPEPLSLIQHQVVRDLNLVQHIHAYTDNNRLRLTFKEAERIALEKKLGKWGIPCGAPFIVIHPGVSEAKRQYPLREWKEIIKKLRQSPGLPMVISGSAADSALATDIAACGDENCINAAGQLTIAEWIILIKKSAALLSVNTGAVHIAAAVDTPCLVLYALTNPQHTPWKVRSAVLPFPVKKNMQSNNQVIAFVNRNMFSSKCNFPGAEEVSDALKMLTGTHTPDRFNPGMLIYEHAVQMCEPDQTKNEAVSRSVF